MNIDYNAVIEILKKFLDNEKIEILGISVGEERQVREAIKNLLTAYEKEKEKNKELEETNSILQDAYWNDSIPKSLVKDTFDKKIIALKGSHIDNILKCEFERLRNELLDQL